MKLTSQKREYTSLKVSLTSSLTSMSTFSLYSLYIHLLLLLFFFFYFFLSFVVVVVLHDVTGVQLVAINVQFIFSLCFLV